MWQRDRETYRKRYYEKEAYISTPYTEFGNKVGRALETGEFFDPLLSRVPRFDVPEHKLEVEINGVPFLMYLDSFNSETKEILEYKTGILGPDGRLPWDRVKVRKHTQLPIYTLGVKTAYGEWAPSIQLVWIETHWVERMDDIVQNGQTFSMPQRELALTGKMEIFSREIKEWELDRMADIIRNVAEEISTDYKLWKKTKTSRYNGE